MVQVQTSNLFKYLVHFDCDERSLSARTVNGCRLAVYMYM